MLEKKWMRANYDKPSGITGIDVLDNLQQYEKLIWENPKDVMLPKYDHSPEEMAILCSEGGAGWLLSSQIEWIFSILNNERKTMLNIVSNATTPEVVRDMASKRIGLVKYNFVVNVGRKCDGSVFISSHRLPGNHWVMVSVDMESHPAKVYYCDSLGWDHPADLENYLDRFITGFRTNGCPSIIMMHNPTEVGPHQCNNRCKNYPLQRCSNVCGVVAVICAAIATLDEAYFSVLCGDQEGPSLFLADPTKYNKYLRRVLMHWFISGNVNIALLKPTFIHVSLDHCYSHASFSVKRKVSADSFSEVPKKIPALQERVRESNICPIVLDHSYSQVVSNSKFSFQESKVSVAAGNAIINPASVDSIETADVDLTPQDRGSNHLNVSLEMGTVSTHCDAHVCSLCTKSYSSARNLRRHKKLEHFIKTKSFVAPSCFCTLCSFQGKTIKHLIGHYGSDHGKDIKILEKTFDSMEDFEKWKCVVEQSSESHYTLRRGKEENLDSYVTRYYCSRSGKSKMKEERQRAVKMQGSRKIKCYCTSFISVKEDKMSGSLNVQCCLDHTGHRHDLMHLPLSENLKSQIVGKLTQGLEPSAVLDCVRNDIVSINRDSLVTKKDIHNLKARNTSCKSQKHKDDSQSVDLWVQELSQDENNPIIFYKSQNRKHDLLSESDFLLCVQTKFQREMLRKHGSKIICMDSTHCTTQYDFLLISILVIYDLSAAVPVAWAITNREDVQMLDIFMNAVKESVGEDITTNFFMSDMAENFYTAWCRCFQKPVQRLYRTWHVDRCWQKKLNIHIKDGDLKRDVYGVLKV